MRHCIKLDGILKSKNYEPILNRINGTCFILKDLYVYADSWNVKVFGVKLKKSIDFQISFLIKKKKLHWCENLKLKKSIKD